MTRSLPSDQKQEQSPLLTGHPTLPNLAPIDRNAKASTAPPTGSPKCPPRQSYSFKPEDDILVQPVIQIDSPEPHRTNNRPISPPPTPPPQTQSQSKSLRDLPTEIQESILNHIAGSLGTPKSSHGSRSWNSRMRHPRRKDLSDLSLVSKTWRSLVQARLYRHLKIKGTTAELSACCNWFMENPRFRSCVRHVEIWVPLFEVATAPRPRAPLRAPLSSPDQEASPLPHTPCMLSDELGSSRQVRYTAKNATLEDIFDYAMVIFPEACALTIEGGHCKKSRKIQTRTVAGGNYSLGPGAEQPRSRESGKYPTFYPHIKIQTLILKGSWNIIRETSDFQNLALALPNLREWHCVYAKPKTGAYKAMCGVLRHFPPTITKINICLEGLNGKQPSSLAKWRRIYPAFHICKDMGRLLPQLETLTFTGHVCACLFRSAINAVSSLRDYPKLRSIDLFVRNCCRDSTNLDDGPSIHNWPFIQAFQQLVVEAVNALGVYPQLSYMRIRFLDLDSPRPLLNPYFHFENDICTGMWDRKILDALAEARPSAGFETTTEDGILEWLEGPIFSRPKSMKTASYAAIGTIN